MAVGETQIGRRWRSVCECCWRLSSDLLDSARCDPAGSGAAAASVRVVPNIALFHFSPLVFKCTYAHMWVLCWVGSSPSEHPCDDIISKFNLRFTFPASQVRFRSMGRGGRVESNMGNKKHFLAMTETFPWTEPAFWFSMTT